MTTLFEKLTTKLTAAIPGLEIRHEKFLTNYLVCGYAVGQKTPSIEEDLLDGIVALFVELTKDKEYPVLFFDPKYLLDIEITPENKFDVNTRFANVEVEHKPDRSEIKCRFVLAQKYKPTLVDLPWSKYEVEPVAA